jgi:glycosyltransferase involved in cell wall biosynthesis
VANLVKDHPLVSICIPAYNAERTIKGTLESVLKQTYQNLEILVIDNDSTDNTWKIIQQFGDIRLIIKRNETNIGAEANFSKCVMLANGEYIAVFHADDLYSPNMIAKQVRIFQSSPTIGAVYTNASFINDKNEIIGHNKLPFELRNKEIYPFSEIFIAILKRGNFLVCPSCMIRGKLYKELIPFKVDMFKTSADLDMWLRVLERHPIAIIDERLMCYRKSDDSYSYRVKYQRTEESDYYKVMDYYLSTKANIIHVSQDALKDYEFQRNLDKIARATNYLVQYRPKEAKKLLKQSISFAMFRVALKNLGKPKLAAYYVYGIVLLLLVNLGLGKCMGNFINRLLDGRTKEPV